MFSRRMLKRHIRMLTRMLKRLFGHKLSSLPPCVPVLERKILEYSKYLWVMVLN